jgi:predicted ATPase
LQLVASTIAATVGLQALDELRDREALLVLDNFEHLLDAAPIVADVLSRGTRTKVVTTSRAPLRVEGEREYPVEPLPDGDALALLAERARAVRPDFEPDDATLELCRRLDGLPLALELAASRLRSLAAAALLDRLDRRLPVLTSGRRDVPERQRTLRATIEWSYDLLDERLRTIFARLGVFATFTLEGAEAVADATFDDVDALVEASLLKPIRGDRFLMLETIREFALERLAASGEADAVGTRHAEHFAGVARSANLNQEANAPMRHEIVVRDRDNMRAALAFCVETQRGELGLQIATALENYWVTSDPDEGRRWVESLLPLGPPPPSELRALAVRCLGNCAAIAGSKDAERLYQECLDEFRQLGDETRVAIALHRIGVQAAIKGEVDRGRALIDESLALARANGFRRGEAACLTFLGDLERRAGAPERALELYERSRVAMHETGFTWWEKNAFLAEALAYFELNRPDEAERCAAHALVLARGMHDRIGIVDCLGFVARAAAEQGDADRAGRLWGAIEAEVQRAPVAGWESERERLEQTIRVRAGAAFDAAREAGRALSLENAVEIAAASLD